MNKYQKKPVIIEVMEYTSENIEGVSEFLGSEAIEVGSVGGARWINIETLEGIWQLVRGIIL